MRIDSNVNQLRYLESLNLDQILCVAEGNITGVLINETNFNKVILKIHKKL